MTRDFKANMYNDQIWAAQLTHRQRVLLHSKELLSLPRRDAHRKSDLDHYDSLPLAIKLFDLIIENFGLGNEIDNDMAELALKPLLQQMDQAEGIPPDSERHHRMVERLISTLRNDQKGRAPFEYEYMDFSEGEAVQRVLGVWLLRDHESYDGRIVLRLSSEAINLFLNALELDIEDAQAATEAIVTSQLRRRRFAEAVQSAQIAKLQSMRLQEKLERVLNETRRDISRVNWKEYVPRLLEETRAHILSRCEIEQQISAYAHEQLEILPSNSNDSYQVAEIARIIDECYHRHQILIERLIGARNIFLNEQERQVFTVSGHLLFPNPLADILEPLFQLKHKEAIYITTQALPHFIGAYPPSVFNLERFISRQLQPPREQRPNSIPVQMILAAPSSSDILRYPESIRKRAETFLEEASDQTLREVLEQATQANEQPAVLECIILRALQLLEPDEDEHSAVSSSKISNDTVSIANIIIDNLRFLERQKDEQ